jgi:Domain of unknown function (DUF4432)
MNNINFHNHTYLKYIGDISQLAGVKKIEFKDGRAKGVEAYEVRTGAGLNYTILADRCLDIAWAEFKGIPFGYISNNGVVAPCFFEPQKDNYFRSFIGGFLSTCGLTYLGAPGIDDGEELSLHGRIGNTPAEEVSVATHWDDENPYIVISGKVRETKFFGENLVLQREIKSYLGANKIQICDRILNEGFRRQPLMVLYHFNYGFPLLQEGAELIAPVRKVIPRDEIAHRGLKDHFKIETPQPGYQEQVFYLGNH